jgi:hypothetical protein
MHETPLRQIRAAFDDQTVRVYQAYGHDIAAAAIASQTLVAPFRRDRMTWIKPSFAWMMYRSGWATKPGQERILAIDISRVGFEWALANACLSCFEPEFYDTYEAWFSAKRSCPVRIQWDPERTPGLARLEYRSIQIGLSRNAVVHYVEDWIQRITDLTDFATAMRYRVRTQRPAQYLDELPAERPYPLAVELEWRIGIAASGRTEWS